MYIRLLHGLRIVGEKERLNYSAWLGVLGGEVCLSVCLSFHNRISPWNKLSLLLNGYFVAAPLLPLPFFFCARLVDTPPADRRGRIFDIHGDQKTSGR